MSNPLLRSIKAAFLALPLALPLMAQMDVYRAAARANSGRLHQYTFSEVADHISNGKVTASETSEYIFVEGRQIKRLVGRNGKPLTPSEQAEESRKPRNVAVAKDEDLFTNFDSRELGEDIIGDRKVLVVELTPKPSHPSGFTHKLWIDQEDRIAIKRVDTVTGKGTLAPGTTVLQVMKKIAPDTWAPETMVLDGHLAVAKFVKPAVRTEYHYSNFRKFDVQSTVTPN